MRMTEDRHMPAGAARRGLWRVALLACLAGCSSFGDDARVLQVLNQRGFGRPTQDANRQYYLGIGDGVIVRSTEYQEYSGQSEVIRMDGTITLADLGSWPAVGAQCRGQYSGSLQLCLRI